jgi:UDP-glucose 4-epimerase
LQLKSLVTGGAGFIGSHVAKHCLGLGHEVVVLDDLSGGFRDQVPEGALFVEGSILDVPLLERLFREHKFDYVYHLAAYAAEGLSHFIRRFNYTNNVVGSVNLVNESVKHEVKCFVFTSSIAVYGHAKPPMREDTTPEPADPYGVAKYAVELDLRAAHEMFGLNYIVFRPHNVYGEHQNLGDPYRNVIGIFMNQTMQGKPMSVFGDGQQTRAFSYIDDVAPVIARSVNVAQSYGRIINVGADTPYSVLDLSRTVAEIFGTKADVVHLPARNEVVHAFSDHGLAESLFGRGEAVSLRDGLSRMAAWARGVGARQSRDFDQIEIEKSLPPSWRAKQGAQN